MDGEVHKAAASWENDTLAPMDRLRSERAESPTPGLVEGTEPGEAGSHPMLSVIRSHRSQAYMEVQPV